jgi:hypothetical protein
MAAYQDVRHDVMIVTIFGVKQLEHLFPPIRHTTT